MEKQEKFRIREFEWFQVQTKVRLMVHQLLTPFQKKIIENNEEIAGLKSTARQHALGIQQINNLIADDPKAKQIKIFKRIFDRLDSIDKCFIEITKMRQIFQERVNSKLQQTQKFLKNFRQIQTKILQLKEQIYCELLNQKNCVAHFFQSFQNSLNHLSQNTKKEFNVLAGNLNKIQLKQQMIQSEIKQLKISNNYSLGLSQQLENFLLNSKMEVQRLNQKLKEKDKEIEIINERLIISKKLESKLDQFQNKDLILHNYILSVLPIHIQCQISNTLFKISMPEIRKKLCIYDEQVLGILDNKVLNLQPVEHINLHNYQQEVEKITKRNYKEIIQLKMNRIKNLGYDIQKMNSLQLEEKLKNIKLTMDMLEDKVQQNLIHLKEKQNDTITKENIQTIIKEYCDNKIASILQRVEIQMNDSKIYLKEQAQENSNQISEVNYHLQQIYKEFKKFYTDQLLQNTQLKKQIQESQFILKKNNLFSATLQKCLSNVFQICSLVNYLMIQDQIDKQSISLFGIRQNFKEFQHPKYNHLPIELDKQCFSCSGFPASAISAFKMACLAYNPTTIKFEDKQYKREQILQIVTKILLKTKNEMNKENLLKTDLTEMSKDIFRGRTQSIHKMSKSIRKFKAKDEKNINLQYLFSKKHQRKSFLK